MGHDLAPFLTPEAICQSSAEAELDETATRGLLALAARIGADPALYAVATAAHHAVYETRDDFTEPARLADAAFGADAARLHALFVLDSLRLVREKQARRGVPAEVSRAVNARHGTAFLKRGLDAGGQVAIDDWDPNWLRVVGSGELYRLGRLEFKPEPWEYPFRAYVNRDSGEAVVLAETGVTCDRDGHLDGEPAFETTLHEAPDSVTGAAISPRGYCINSAVRLPSSEWRLELGPRDRVLDLHVPAEGRLSSEALHSSLVEAETFFDRYYPDERFVAYVCDSWLFSTQLEQMLSPDSNILCWQRQGYLLPTKGGHDSFVFFTFGTRTIDPKTAPRNTQLRRAVIAHLEHGSRLRSGAWLLLRRDRSRFGHEPYRAPSARAIARFLDDGGG